MHARFAVRWVRQLLALVALAGSLGSCAPSRLVWQSLTQLRAARQPIPEDEFRTVAILPVQVVEVRLASFLRSAPAPNTPRWLRQQRRRYQQAFHLQAALYRRLRAKQHGKRREHVWLQPPLLTNWQLRQAGLPLDSLLAQSPQQLRQLLGTSHILRGQATVLRFPLGLTLPARLLFPLTLWFLPSGVTTTTLTLQQCQSGSHVWEHRYLGTSSPFWLGGPSRLAKDIARPVPREFPYR